MGWPQSYLFGVVRDHSRNRKSLSPFSYRQSRRECASFTDNSSKYFSQYGRSSARGRVAKTCFDPMRVAFRVNACYLHIIEVLVAAIDSRPSVPSAIGLASA
ncbi:MAG: hypothetical protein DME45_10170 [Verrucomicrobia bacterium]|nr:MAG: hypothetical protein DME45_10170 [Verrucomicrobiota bacterium]